MADRIDACRPHGQPRKSLIAASTVDNTAPQTAMMKVAIFHRMRRVPGARPSELS
jgi:hypothetical protein